MLFHLMTHQIIDVMLISYLLLSLTGAILISKGDDPAKLIPFVSTISMGISTFLGSLICSKKTGGSPIVSSALFITAVIFSILVMTLIYMKEINSIPLWQNLLLKIPAILGGIFGGFISSLKKKPKSLYAKYK